MYSFLSREFLLNGPFDCTERNLVKPPAALDRSREQDPIAHKLVLIQNPRLDVNAADARVESDRGREAAIAERVGNAEFGKNRPPVRSPIAAHPFVAKVRPRGRRQPALTGHGCESAAVEGPIKFPKVAAVLLARYDVRRLDAEVLPLSRSVGSFHQQLPHRPGPKVKSDAVILVLDRTGIFMHRRSRS